MLRSQPFALAVLMCGAFGCDRNLYVPPGETDDTADTEPLVGTGSYTFDGYAPLADKPVRVFYHVPEATTPDTPIVLVFHGTTRNADEYRDAWIRVAEDNDFAVFAPEFSDTYYPGSNAYHLGNVFDNGERPSAATLRPSSQWTYAVIAPLFDDAVDRLHSNQDVFQAFGHSAGAQFVHRMALLVPAGPYGTLITANAGWYTMPDPDIDFPYGLGETPSATAPPEWFGLDLAIHAGTNDTNPDSAGLRHTEEADAQGDNRFERAHYFDERSEDLANAQDEPYTWQIVDVPGVAHDEDGMSAFAGPWLAEHLARR